MKNALTTVKQSVSNVLSEATYTPLRMATIPMTDRTVKGELSRMVRGSLGAFGNSFVVTVSVAALYLLMNPPREGESRFYRFGKAYGVGILSAIGVEVGRRLVGGFR